MSNNNDNFHSASLYVGDLAHDVNEALLFEIFNAVGPVASIRVCRDAVTRRSLGYAYVNFHNAVDAERALDTMNFSQINNRPCRIMWSQRDPSLRKSGKGNIFVKNIDESIDHKTLYDTFSVFGNILSCKVAMDSNGDSLGYGFVHYETDESAKNAIDNADGMVIAGRQVIVQPFKPKSEREKNDVSLYTNVYVKNLPENMTEESFVEMFSKFGPITSSMLSYDADGKFKGFGFINFENPEDAALACEELNDTEVEGKVLFVARAMKKYERMKLLRERFEKYKVDKQKKWAGCNLYVKNLADTIEEEKLREEFEKFGPITSTKVMCDGNGRSKGFGFVCFANPEDASKAMQEMNGKILERKPLYVAFAQRKEVRRAQLEAQYSRRKIGAQIPPMFPATGPMYFAGPQPVPSRQGFMYPPQNMVPARRWGPQGGPAPVVGQPMGMYGVPQNGPSGARGGRGGRGGSGRGYKYTQAPRTRQEVPLPGAPSLPEGAAPSSQTNALTLQALAAASPEEQKQIIGERLFPAIRKMDYSRAGKITGMLLEMDNSDLLDLLESSEALQEKVQEAISVLDAHEETA